MEKQIYIPKNLRQETICEETNKVSSVVCHTCSYNPIFAQATEHLPEATEATAKEICKTQCAVHVTYNGVI